MTHVSATRPRQSVSIMVATRRGIFSSSSSTAFIIVAVVIDFLVVLSSVTTTAATIASPITGTTKTTTTSTSTTTTPAAELEMAHFSSEYICFDATDFISTCIERVNSRSRLECAALCLRDVTCIGMSRRQIQSCYKHYSCAPKRACSTDHTEIRHRYYVKNKCLNGGIRNSVTENKCDCKNGWVGATCQERPAACADLENSGYPPGRHKVLLKPNNPSVAAFLPLIPLECVVLGNGITTITVLTNSGNASRFNRTFAEYRAGFYSADGSYDWIGLDNWHALSLLNYRTLKVAMFVTPALDAGQNADPDAIARTYTGFNLTGRSQGYRFTFTSTDELHFPNSELLWSMGNSMGDCFRSFAMTSFSAVDHDVDGQPLTNCAAVTGYGWWHLACNTSSCGLLGVGPKYWGGRSYLERMIIPNVELSLPYFQDKYVHTSLSLSSG